MSLRTQSLTDLEIVVVDDGSTDNTLEVIRAHAAQDRRITVLTPTPMRSAAGARNAGLRATRGRYIALLDGDDIALPHRLERTVRVLDDTGAEVAFADFSKFRMREVRGVQVRDDEPGYLSSKGFTRDARRYLDPVSNGVYRCRPAFVGFMLSQSIALNVPTVVISRRALERQPTWFDRRLVGGEDLDLFYRLASAELMVYIDEVLTHVRMHPTSLTATHAERCSADAIEVRLTQLRRLAEFISPEEKERAKTMVSRSLFSLAYDRWTKGRNRDARHAFIASWNIAPTSEAALGFVKTFFPREKLIAVAHAYRRSVLGRRSIDTEVLTHDT